MQDDLNHFRRNPLSILALTIIVSIFAFWGSAKLGEQNPISSRIMESVGVALLISGGFGVLFEFYQKKTLMQEIIKESVGLDRVYTLGIVDAKLYVEEIDNSIDIRNSSLLQIGTRKSSAFFNKYRQPITNRLEARKNISIIMMSDASHLPSIQGAEHSPVDFFKRLRGTNDQLTTHVSISTTAETLCYNFVRIDTGIWVKLYFNAKQTNLPPTFFVKKDSLLYKSFAQDIDLLFEGADGVNLNE